MNKTRVSPAPKTAPAITSRGVCALTEILLWAMRTDSRKLKSEAIKLSVIYVTATHAENAIAE
jgi:hypothetical protein